MRTKAIAILTLLALSLTVVPTYASEPADSTPELSGAKAAAADSTLTVQDMLTYAQQDEYLAKGEYQTILKAYGNQRVFSNILKAEETHISLLTPLLEQYGVPAVTSADLPNPIVPESLKTAYTIGVQAEIENIAMYEGFLETQLPADVESVFLRLMKASESHLKAFEQNLSRTR